MFAQSIFKPAVNIPQTAKVVFVSDMFVSDYVGGAELTSQALIDSAPFEVFCLHSKDVTVDLLRQHVDKFWIFGNFTALNSNLIPTIIANIRYSIIEYDYKYCAHRSPEKHAAVTKSPCDCHNKLNGKIVSSFFYGASIIWWMSEKQSDRYTTIFPFLSEKPNIVLSSVFSDVTLGKLAALRRIREKSPKNGWIVQGSNSWIKGTDSAIEWCKSHNVEYEVTWDLSYDDMLAKFASAEGFVYLPKGGDTCPRTTIEAKLLGCKLQLNDDVQHKDEVWFDTDDIESIEGYLRSTKKMFWDSIKNVMEYTPKISGYVTTHNCVKQEYPFEECIKSMLTFCDEVCVVDANSDDQTWERLIELAYPEFKTTLGNSLKIVQFIEDMRTIGASPYQSELSQTKIKLKNITYDWSHPHFAVFDGMQKQEARSMCTGDFCWQMDADEVVTEQDVAKIKSLCHKMPNGIDVLSLPVIEFWGKLEKVRVDVQPWKWRLSRNKENVGHGIPIDLRRYDDDGMYAAPGTDGCDMIDIVTGERLPHVTFHNEQSEQVRRAALMGVPGALDEYERWFNMITDELPSVFHYSWLNIERKIRLYRDYWTHHWLSLQSKRFDDTAEQNMMFDVPWSQVTDEMITKRAKELAEKLGGWIWHRKWDGTITPHITVYKTEPRCMIDTRVKKQ